MHSLRPTNFELATAEITYRLPDFPSILQTYIWQDFDIPPRYPRLAGFLDFWETKLDGQLHSVRITSCSLFGSNVRFAHFLTRIH